MKTTLPLVLLSTVGFPAIVLSARAAEIVAPGGESDEYFGSSVSISGSTGLVGASGERTASGPQQGAAFFFQNFENPPGPTTEVAKLIRFGSAAYEGFGSTASLSGTSALVGASSESIGSNVGQGSAYLFRDLDTATGTVTQNTKLTASDGTAYDRFGASVSLSGNNGLIGAAYHKVGSNIEQGSAYLFRNLDTATGNITESAKLTASGGSSILHFGSSVNLAGSRALIGAEGDKIGSNFNQGSAFLFRNLDSIIGSVTESVKLVASDGAGSDFFGRSSSLWGDGGLVAAHADDIGSNANQGSAYLFRDLDTATGTVTQTAKLIASDGAAADTFGNALSISANSALIGASEDDIGTSTNRGSVYLFNNLDTVTGLVTESVKLTATDGAGFDHFGGSVSLDGDRFVVGAIFGNGAGVNTGKAYTGSVSAVTKLDIGNTSRDIDGLSFTSREDWIIGQTTDGNSVNLAAGDTADIKVGGREVYIGQDVGSDHNTLDIAGILRANTVNIGALTGNAGNALVLRSTANIVNAVEFIMGEDAVLSIEGDLSAQEKLMTYLKSTRLRVWDGTALHMVSNSNQSELLQSSFSGGFTTFNQIPEPSGLLFALTASLGLLRRRRWEI